MNIRRSEKGLRTDGFSPDRSRALSCPHAHIKTVLLISKDRPYHEHLRSLANERNLMVVRALHGIGITRVLHAVQPDAVLLDLDLANDTAWETADQLLDIPDCPPVLLITGRTGHLEMQIAVSAGALASKSDTPGRLLDMIEEVSQTPPPVRGEKNTAQRTLIRWLKPSAWTDSAPAYRFWGINE